MLAQPEPFGKGSAPPSSSYSQHQVVCTVKTPCFEQVSNGFLQVFHSCPTGFQWDFHRISQAFHRCYRCPLNFSKCFPRFIPGCPPGKKNDTAAFVVPPNAPPAIRPRTARWWGRRSLGSQKKPPDIGEDIYLYMSFFGYHDWFWWLLWLSKWLLYGSLDWWKGKSTGNHAFPHQI